MRACARACCLLALAVASAAQAQETDQVPPPPATANQPRPALIAPIAAESRLTSIALAGKRLVAVGQEGLIIWSDDGRHWTQAANPVSGMLDRVRFFDASNGWILGYDGIILQTADGGKSWALRNFRAGAHPLYDLIFLDAQHAIAIGGFGDYLVSTDAGQTWAPQHNPLSALGMHMNAIRRLGDGSLFIAGERGLMARSSDQGATWALLDSPYAGSFFGALLQGEHGVLVFGLQGNVWTTADAAHCSTMDYAKWDVFSRHDVTDPAKIAALGWKHLDNPANASLFGGDLLPDGEALLVGVNGAVEKTQLQAGRVVPLHTPAAETLGGVQLLNGRMIAVGRRGAQDLGVAP
ncbi:MAG: WD40/YVTN/BNR-like repeat-containing protein [Stenotrophobium sp.]